METYDIYHDFAIRASASEVFERIADPGHLENWWPLQCSGKPEVGAIYNFYFTPEYDWFGKVITYEPDSAFHIKMIKADTDWENTTFGFDMEAGADGVNLKFFHESWPERNHHFRRSSFCWAMLLNGLKDYCEKGTIVPFEERD
ncbi:MAG: SRPBCC domain-containing protein [Pricia sp.]